MQTKTNKLDLYSYIEENITDIDLSYRGGVIKVDLSKLFTDKSLEAISEAGEEAIAGSSQNYLGGGIAGRITTGRTFDLNLLTKSDYKKYLKFCDEIIKYHYNQNNGGGDDYMQDNVNCLEQNKRLPVSGY